MDPLRNEGVSEVHALPRSESELQRKKTGKKEKKKLETIQIPCPPIYRRTSLLSCNSKQEQPFIW